jgi:hypothetical protein
VTNINLTKHSAAQDMVRIVMDKKGLPAQEAIASTVNHDIYLRIIEAGYASIAVDLWGHGGPARRRLKLKEPQIEIEFDELSQGMLNEIMKKEMVDLETALSYFLIFTMESFGYHI